MREDFSSVRLHLCRILFYGKRKSGPQWSPVYVLLYLCPVCVGWWCCIAFCTRCWILCGWLLSRTQLEDICLLGLYCRFHFWLQCVGPLFYTRFSYLSSSPLDIVGILTDVFDYSAVSSRKYSTCWSVRWPVTRSRYATSLGRMAQTLLRPVFESYSQVFLSDDSR